MYKIIDSIFTHLGHTNDDFLHFSIMRVSIKLNILKLKIVRAF